MMILIFPQAAFEIPKRVQDMEIGAWRNLWFFWRRIQPCCGFDVASFRCCGEAVRFQNYGSWWIFRFQVRLVWCQCCWWFWPILKHLDVNGFQRSMNTLNSWPRCSKVLGGLKDMLYWPLCARRLVEGPAFTYSVATCYTLNHGWYTLPETKIAPETTPCQAESCLPTISCRCMHRLI